MAYNCKVKKHNGEQEDFSIEKIQKTINLACKDLDVNPTELESKVSIDHMHDLIDTSQIIETLMLSALSLTSETEPDWKIVAGRLKLINHYKNITRERNNHVSVIHKSIEDIYSPESYYSFLQKATADGYYSTDIMDSYSREELLYAGSWINYKYDFDFDYSGMNILINDSKELPQEIFLSLALFMERDSDDRLLKARYTYNLLASRKLSLATPLLMNARKRGSNLSSCFVTLIDDNRESIFYVIDQISNISKEGGGVGVNISRVRSKGSRIKGVKNASGGVVPWIRIINDTAVAVNQLGKRKGAVSVSLDIWHLDILDFLELQTENGDQRMKAYDIFPQVLIPDLFMKAATNNESWLLVDPNEVRIKYKLEIGDLWGAEFERLYERLVKDALEGELELFKFVDAKSLLKKIMQSQIETGLPYLAFKDTLNRYNPNKHDGAILSTNLCTESHSNVKPTIIGKDIVNSDGSITRTVKDGLVHVCNLLSVNLANIEDSEELELACRTGVRLLDNCIDYTNVPVKEGLLHNNRYRTIGVGATGLADWLAKHQLTYNNANEVINDLFEEFAIYCIEESIRLAAKKGTFEAYEGSELDKGFILGRNEAWYEKNTKHPDRWGKIFKNLSQHGIRNSQITAIAPNTTSALIQGCTPSILPVYSKFYVDNHGKGNIPNCPPFLKDYGNYYIENKNIPQSKIIDVAAIISKWIDTGVSLELVYDLNKGITATDIYKNIMKAWASDIKTIYYTRTIQQDGGISETKEECAVCAG